MSFDRKAFYSSPEQLAKARARKERYRGSCNVCGQSTTGCNGYKAPDLCATHAAAARRIWTRESVVAAIRRYDAEYGRAPSATAWRTRGASYWPATATVQSVFGGSWSAALDAAGVEPNPVGRPRKAAA